LNIDKIGENGPDYTVALQCSFLGRFEIAVIGWATLNAKVRNNNQQGICSTY